MGGQFKGSLASPTTAQFQVWNGTANEIICSVTGTYSNSLWSSGNATAPYLMTAGDKVFMLTATNTAQTVQYQKLNLMLMRVD